MFPSFPGAVRRNEPLAAHTTFRVGGPADLWVRPEGDFPVHAAALFRWARAEGRRVFVLGGGANLVVSDRGVRGLVLDLGGWTGVEDKGPPLRFRAGTPVDAAVDEAARRGLSGLEFLAGMPGTIGGAVWMNARCYDREVADALVETTVLDLSSPEGVLQKIPSREGGFGYKKSPFQGRELVILAAAFALTPGDPGAIRREMEAHRRDREAKGHYRFPSAGSVFKNNRAFGAPTGKIIDDLGLRGLRVGGAQVAPWHGNIIINTGGARAGDIRALVDILRDQARRARGIELESEVIFAGDWGEPPGVDT